MTAERRDPADQAQSSPGRRTFFRLTALALPFLLVFVLETALRLGGYGYPTSFFLKRQLNQTRTLVENPKFGWRFFPPTVARSPQRLQFAATKPADTLRIFLFGESAAMGDPEPAYGLGRQLQRLLQARHQTRHIEVINVAMTAINSHVIRSIAEDCATRQGDVWLIYAGNNEVVGPFGAGTVFGAQAPNLLTVRMLLGAKTFRVGQLLVQLSPRQNEPKHWEGMELFLQNQVPAWDPRLARVYDNFTANLSAIINLGRSSGARIILSTVAVNLRDCPPFGSAHRPTVPPSDLTNWEKKFARGKEAESTKRYADALAEYQQAARLDDGFAELIFRRAQCELRLSDTNAARAGFSLARDLDTLRFRTDSRLNEIIRRAAIPGVSLVDAERELSLSVPDGLPGEEQFYDHVHLNFSGNYLVARRLAERVEKELFSETEVTGPWLSEAEVSRQLAFTDFDRHRIGEEMRMRLRQPPFSTQSNFQERDQQWQRMLSAPHAGPEEAVWEYRAALALAPNDWVVRENFARLLGASGDRKSAYEQWAQVAQAIPGEPESYFQLGNLAFDAGAYDQAAAQFRRVLQLRPNAPEAHNGLGLVLASQGRTNDALAEFDKALGLNPRFSGARVNRAVLIAKGGNFAGAVGEYQNILRLDTNNVAARINLAKLQLSRGNADEAIALYTRALELKPDNPIGHFDLGNALSAQGRHPEALQHFASAVEQDPGFAEAQYNLAVELARFGRIAEALPHFAEAVRLLPDAADAHFNYGIALAKGQRYSDAAQQFQETLKLQPDYPSAQAMLTRALQRSSGGPLLP